MLNDTRIERFARAIGRRLTTPPSTAVREQHLRDITQAVATESRTATNGKRVPVWASGLSRSRRLIPAFAAVMLIVIVTSPLISNSGNDLPMLSAAAVGGPQTGMAADALMERKGSDGSAAASAPDIMWLPERYEFVLADGVEIAAGSQPAWQMGIDGSLTERADELRALFGLTSVQPSEWDPNVLVAGDPEQASVTLYPTGEWYFANYSAFPQWNCPDVGGQGDTDSAAQVEPNFETQTELGSNASQGSEMREPSDVIEPYECTPPPAAKNLPSSAAVLTQTTELFAQLGITNLTFETPYRDEWTVGLWGTQRFDALPDYNGQGVSVTFGAEGEILGAYGTFARPTLIGDYPTVSASDAVARLNTQFADDGSMARPLPYPAIDGGDMPVSNTESSGDTELVTVEVTLVEAAIVLAPIWTPDGFTVLAPHYRFTDSDGQQWWVAAVTDRYLAG
ncbi:MAG: hypothetical protein WD360_08180 [Nitriliruptoraceae bacterium]